MATVTVKNIPDELYQRLKASARAHRRSINSEIIVCIERSVGIYPVDPERLIAEARRLRELTAQYTVDDDAFTRAKSAGRP